MNKQSNTKFSMIMLLVFLSTLLAVIAAPIITLEKTEYELGENIEIYLNISDTGNLTIDLVTPSYLFKYLSPGFKIPYMPTELGLHTINLYQDFNLVETESFEVISDIPTLDYLWLEKADFDFNEVVIIYFNESLLQPSYKLRILSKSQTFNYVNGLTSSLKFLPKDTGVYEIQLYDDTTIIETDIFNVVDEDEIVEKIEILNETEVNETTVQEKNEFNITIEEPVENLTEPNITEYYENETNITVKETNETVNVSVKKEVTIRSDIIVGQPVKWTKYISLESPENLTLELTSKASNIIVKKIEDGYQREIEAIILKPGEDGSAFKIENINSIEDLTEYIISLFSGDNQEESKNIKVILEENTTEYIVEYFTEPASIQEIETETGKQVLISAPDELNYSNVTSFTSIPEVLDIGNEDRIKVYWLENNSYVDFTAEDTNDNLKLDYVEWITPHLSNQTFEIIIEIVTAVHLDENRIYIEDIYNEVKERDGIWKEIPEGHYIRVTFQENLTDLNDITIYARSNNGSVQVYEKDSSVLIADFGLIDKDKKYQVLLTNLTENQDTFDLKIIGNAVEFDYVVDPTISQFYDDFETNNLNLWTESGDGEWDTTAAPGAGHGSFSAHVDGAGGGAYEDSFITLASSIDLSGQIDCTLTFDWYKAASAEATDELSLDIYDGAWNNGVWADDDTEGSWQSVNIDLDASYNMVSGFLIRFEGYANGANDEMYIDFVNISCQDDLPSVSLNYPPTDYVTYVYSPNGTKDINFNCSVTDDINATNISLYITNNQNTSFSFNDSCTLGATTGSCNWSKTLDIGNYTWNCLAYDSYNSSDWDVNRSIEIIYTQMSPTITDIQCYKIGSGWVDCTTTSFGDTLDSVRSNCYSNIGGSVSNVSYFLRNVEDDNTFFNGTVTTNATGYWEYNFSDLTIDDSGSFNLNVVCRDNPENSTDVNWTIPWGELQGILIDPTTSKSVVQNTTFNFTTRLTCSGGECDDVNATLDPATDWWNDTFSYRKLITITNNHGSEPIYRDYTFNFTADTTGINFQDDGDDVRIIWWNSSSQQFKELDRINTTTFNQTNTEIKFSIQENIAASSSDTNYYMYYSNPSASNPPNNETNVYWFIDRFNRADSSNIGPGWEEWLLGGGSDQVAISSNILRVGGNNVGPPDMGARYNFSEPIPGDFILEYTWDIISNTEGIWLHHLGIGDKTLISPSSKTAGIGPGLFTGEANGMDAAGTEEVANTVTTTELEAGITGTYDFRLTVDKSAETYTYERIGYTTIGSVAYANAGITTLDQLRIYTDQYIDTQPDFGYDDILVYLFLSPGPSALLSSQQEPPKGWVNTTPGAKPFWTSSPNPYSTTTKACLRNMVDSDTCDTTWLVNASGDINTVWKFFVIYEPTTYASYIPDNITKYVNITIVDMIRPEISNIQCKETGQPWDDCSNIQFNDELTSVRAECSYDLGGPIQNMTFRLKNIDDDYTFFDSVTTDNSTGYWELDITDFNITDSGLFNLYTTCSVNPTGDDEVNWSIGFGSYTVTLLPLTDQNRNVVQDQFFTYRAELNCSGGECGNTNTSLWYKNADASLQEIEFIGFEDDAVEEAKWIDDAAPSGALSVEVGTDWTPRTGSFALAMTGNIDPPWDYWYRNISLLGYSDVSTIMYSSTEDTEAADDYEMYYWNGTGYAYMWAETNRASASQTPWVQRVNPIPSYAVSNDFRIRVGWSTSSAAETMLLDDVNVTGYRIYDWNLLNTTSGDLPFYTTDPNTIYPSDNSCLGNMTHGSSCTLTWQVNATGQANSVWNTMVRAESINYSQNISSVDSSIINLTIVNNTPPNVTSISIIPDYPEDFHNLYCYFTVEDPDVFDNLYVNVTWYRDNVTFESNLSNVSNGVEYNDVMESSNTSINEEWFCSVTPYDTSGIGYQTNSTRITILSDAPPLINSIECQEDNTTWGSCTIIGFNDYLTRVRANCTDTQKVENATFSLVNIPDNYEFFNTTISYQIGDYFTLNITDILIRDSGEFRLNVVCRDNASNSRNDYSNWTVPWGTLTASLISPDVNVNVSQGAFFTWTSRVTCTGGECGHINATLDPNIAYVNATFDADAEGFVYADEIYEGTFGVDSAGNYVTSNTYCYSAGNCLEVYQDSTISPDSSGGWNISFNVTGNPEYVNVSFYWTNFQELGADAGEYSRYYFRNISNGAEVLLDQIEAGGPPIFNSGTYSFIVYLSDGEYSFDAGGVGTTTSGADEDSGHYLDNVLIVGVGAQIPKGDIPTTPGSTPFWTSSDNPQGYGYNSCLSNMTDGSTCDTTWEVNATGEINSKWEFFAYYNASVYGSYISNGYTPSINITIVTNTLPNITYLDLLPIFPPVYSDLYCNFTIFDPDFDNDLYVNVTWYLDNVTFESNLINVTSGQMYSEIMEASNTSLNEEWFCSVTPYDNFGPGNNVNSSHRIILDNAPPLLTAVECQVENSSWIDCTSITYGANLTAVRANCTDDGRVENVTYKFYNVEDDNTYFNNLSTYNISQQYVFNNSDIYILDSGNFYMNVTCNDNSSLYDVEVDQWFIPWGTLSSQLIDPAADTNVQVNAFFNFIASVTCTGGECGDVNATLDPYIDNVQEDSFTFSGTTGTDTLPSAVALNTSILFHSVRQNEADPSDGNIRCRLSGSSTITCDRSTSNNNIYVQWHVAEFQPGGAYVQRDSSATSLTTTNINIPNSVNLSKSFVIFSREHAGSQYGNDDFERVRLTSSTNIEAALNGGSGGTMDWQVIEYENSFVQRDIISMAGSSITDTIPTPVDPSRSFILVSYNTPSGTIADIGQKVIMAKLLNGSVIEFTRDNIGVTLNIAWEVIELNDKSEVRSGNVTFTTGTSQIDVDFNAVDLTRSVAFGSVQSTSGLSTGRTSYSANDVPGVAMFSFELIDSDTIRITRDSAAASLASAEVYWQVVEFDDGLKHGKVSTISGDTPFYTTDSNPLTANDLACLGNLTSGQTCQVTWAVNATGELGTTHEFFVDFDPIVYISQVASETTSSVYLTITDASDVPPSVFLISPDDNLQTNNVSQELKCEATDNLGLYNMTLYADFDGTFGPNETVSISGLAANVTFNITLPEGRYSWNCRAFDTDGNDKYAASNRTLIIDLTGPIINLTQPDDNESFNTNLINFSWIPIDNFASSVTCNLTIKAMGGSANYSDDDIIVLNNTEITRLQNIGEFTNYTWNVTCIDQAGNINTSETRFFRVLDLPPIVELQTQDNYWVNQQNITLYYNASDNVEIDHGDLYLNGEYNQTNSEIDMYEFQTFELFNLSEGIYNWTVNVTDNGNLTAQAPERWFYIDYTEPTIILNYPNQSVVINSSSITINFTVIDNMDDILDCDIMVNNSIEASLTPNNNTPTQQLISDLKDGLNYWNITCSDEANNYNTSQTLVINVSGVPYIELNLPPDNFSTNNNNIYLNYTPYDNTNLSSCDLLINGAYNETESSPVNGVMNSFYVEDLLEGTYIWAINCTDLIGLHNISENRTFYIDFTQPNVTLLYPNHDSLLTTTQVQFNFTVIDNIDLFLSCNLTLDGTINKTGIIAQNNTVATTNVTMSQEAVHYWNITCEDDAGNYNTSATWNFTLFVPPTVNLLTPPDNYFTNINDINFTYFTVDSSGIENATLIINSQVNYTDYNVTNDDINYFNISNMQDGVYTWTVTVFDNDNLSTTPTVRTLTIDTTPPNLTIIIPLNNTNVTTNNFSLEFSVWDNLDDTLRCHRYYNGALDQGNISVVNDTISSTTKIENDGNYNWSVICYDEVNNSAYSGLINFTVIAPPNVTLDAPPNATRTRNTSITFYFTPYDDFGLQNCTLILDGELNDSINDPGSGVQQSIPANNISEGLHNWTVQCVDNPPDLNPFSPSEKYFRIDLTGPMIVLNDPEIDETFNLNNVTFNYTAYETDYVLIDCNITVSDSFGDRLNFTQEFSGVDHIIRIDNLSDGDHYWNVTCADDLGNINISETRRFIINQPDLETNNSRISLSNTNPDLYENITIYVNITNIGGQPANNLVVSFYDGNPGLGGSWIANDTGNVGVNTTVEFSTTWLIPPGYHNVFAIADYTDVIPELDEGNNNASLNISVLWSNITGPENITWWNNLTVEFNFTLRDYTGQLINYSVYVDGAPNGQTGNATDGTNNSVNITFSEGTRTVFIRATDELGRIKDSQVITVYIDVTAPSVNFNTQNQTWFNTATPEINFTIDDNMDTLLNYTVYVNGNPDQTGVATDNIPELVNLSALPNGTHIIIVETYDEAGNWINSTPLTIYVDTVEPTIALLYPGDGVNLFTNFTELNFTVIDNLDQLLQCNITLDNNVVETNLDVTNNTVNGTQVVNLTEGTHYWNVSCWDGNSVTPVNMLNTSETRSFNIYNAPTIKLLAPDNATWSNNVTNYFYFNASDETGLQNCSILLNGVIQDTKIPPNITNADISNFTISNLNGTYIWEIECYDNTSFNNYEISENRTIFVDLDSPEPYIETLNHTWFNYDTPLINFNITDNMDSVINYTFYVNGFSNAQGAVNNNTPSTDNLNTLADGAYNLTLEGRDEATNRKNSTSIIIYVDTTEPTIELHRPENGNSTIETNIFYNFTATDNMADTFLCNLTVDNIVRENFNVSSGISNSTILLMTAGLHYWNVTCLDIAGNFNTSATWNFTIPLPDLTLISSDIKFNTTQPQEGKNITINATVYNNGETDAEDVIIKFFVGNYTLGNQINGNITRNISAGENITVNLTWQVSGVGQFDIYVVLDPPIATGGTIFESNESNNYAFNTIEVGSYTIVYGNLTGLLNIQDIQNRTIYEWNITDYNGSKIFVVDVDSTVNWDSLQAISRNITNDYVSNDFYEIDLALSTENNSDSINQTWTINSNPRLTNTYVVYLNPINDVPIVNSTNTSNFQTGILWDTDDGGNEYDGSQDIVFLTTVNVNQQGKYGIYDYELKIPSNLRLYQGPNQVTVALYTELP